MGVVLAFDFGTQRIGVAVGNTTLCSAQPLLTIAAEKAQTRFAAIADLIETWQPVLVVVGLPLQADGGEQETTRRSRRFARQLQGRFGIEVVLVDERGTTLAARVDLNAAGVRGSKQKPLLDKIAAQHILQAYFDQRFHADVKNEK